MSGLAALEARLAEDLALLEYPPPDWVVPHRRPDGSRVLEVAIIGAGMVGQAVAFALLRDGVPNILCLDAAPEGQEGPWLTYARMLTLRSPKFLQGPSMGIGALTFRAWYTAQHGAAGWKALDKPDRPTWMAYLAWYRRVLALPVRNHAAVTRIVPDGALFALHLAGGEILWARHVVLATGRDGLGGPQVPAEFVHLPPSRCAHSRDAIDFSALAGKRVAVIGAGASAIDNAATALEAGAAEVTLLVRRAELPRVNKFTATVAPGFTHGLATATPAWRRDFYAYMFEAQVPIPRDSLLRFARHRPRARLWLGAPVREARLQGDTVVLATPKGTLEADFVILGTGFVQDISRRPELAEVAPEIALWRHHDPASGMFADYPWLDAAFAFTPRPGVTAPHLARLHCFNFAATASHGKVSGDIPAISDGVARLSRGIAAALFNADIEAHFARIKAFSRAELQGDEWPEVPARAAE
jgi:cation diffusion facilitator CzcD-associated flavoprotein CzcO